MRAGDVHDVVVVIGVSVLGRWLEALVRQLCAAGGIELAEGGADEHFPDLGRPGGAPRVLMVGHLSRRVIDLIEARRLAVLAVLDDPVDSVRFCRAEAEIGLMDALRLQTRAAATNDLFRDNPLVRLVQRGTRGFAHALIDAVVEQVGVPLSPDALGGLRTAFGGPPDAPWTLEQALLSLVPRYLQLDHLADAMAAEDAALVRQVLSPLAVAALQTDIGMVTWTPRVFLWGDRPDEPVPPVADVTGAARIIFYGPYFCLPAGTWTSRMVVAFSHEVRGTPFRMDVVCEGEPIAKVMLRPTGGGAYEAFFTLHHARPERAIEVQFGSQEGTIEGHVALGQVTFTRLPA